MSSHPRDSPLLGVLGGLGPLASARFVETIYRFSGHLPEREQPRLVLLSDPFMPDRTQAIVSGDLSELGRRIEVSLGRLDACGAEALVPARATSTSSPGGGRCRWWS